GPLVETAIEPEFTAALENLANIGVRLGLVAANQPDIGPDHPLAAQLDRFKIDPVNIDGPVAAEQASAYTELALRLLQWRDLFTVARADDPATDYTELTASFADALAQVRDAAYGWQKALNSVRVTAAVRANTPVGNNGGGVTVEYLNE